MKEVKDYSPSKDAHLINCKTECGNERCFAKRYGLFAEKTCQNFVEPKPITNSDRIRSMTDKELAEMMSPNDSGCPPIMRGGKSCFGQISCEKCWLDWLNQEASDGETP